MRKTTDRPTLDVYSDSDFAQCLATSRSTGGGIIVFGGMVIDVFCKRMSVITRSVCEAELYTGHAMAVAGTRCLAILQFLGWNIKQFTLHMDNAAAVEMTTHVIGSRSKSRSMRLRNHDMKELVEEGLMRVKHISGLLNPSDGFSKPLSGDKWKKFHNFLQDVEQQKDNNIF